MRHHQFQKQFIATLAMLLVVGIGSLIMMPLVGILFNLMRNIGGSIGIAVTGTMLQRQRQVTATLLGETSASTIP